MIEKTINGIEYVLIPKDDFEILVMRIEENNKLINEMMQHD